MQEQVPPEPENLKKPDNYECGDCGDFFPSKAKLWEHIQKHMADDKENEDGDEGYEDHGTEESVPKEVKGQVSLKHGNNYVNKCSVDDDSEDIATKRQTQSAVKEAGASGKTVRNQKKANSDTLSIFCRICEEHFVNMKELDVHVDNKHPYITQHCQIKGCNYLLSTTYGYLMHARKHW